MKTLVTGDWQHADFVDVLAGLPPQTKFCDLDALRKHTAIPDLIVLAQSRRHQFNGPFAEQLRQRWPAVPAVNLLSSWNEGESRSGKPLGGWVRVLWHRWPGDFARFQAARRAGRPTLWDRVAESASLMAAELKRLPGGQCLQIGVFSRWNSEALVFQQMLEGLGHSVDNRRGLAQFAESSEQIVPAPLSKRGTGIVFKSQPNLDAVMIVGDSCDAWIESRLRAAKLAQRQSLKIIALNFPRRHEVDRLQQIGGRNLRVLSKPFELQQVQQLLQSYAASRGSEDRIR